MSAMKPVRSTHVRPGSRRAKTMGTGVTGLLFLVFSAWLVLGAAASWAAVEGRRWPRNDPGPARAGACVTYSFMADGTAIPNPPDSRSSGPGDVSDFDATVAADPNVGGVANARAAIRTALNTWQLATDIHFLEVADNGVAFNAAGAVGDIRFGGHTFSGTTLAHGYYPPANGVSAAGDIHFDGGYNWSTVAGGPPAGNYDLQSTALHEIGHAIGLTHAPAGPDVMDPTIAAGTTERVLTVGAGSDTALIQSIYGLPGHAADCTGIVGIVTGTPTLPPPGVYLTPAQVHAEYSGLDLEILLSRVEHAPFAADLIEQRADGEHEFFQSSLNAHAKITVGPPTNPQTMEADIKLLGDVHTVVYEKKTGEDTGAWDTEILSMDLSGVVETPLGPMTLGLRESPEFQSTGRVYVTEGSTNPQGESFDETLEPPGAPRYQINSFFDVFTEISLDRGPWIPARDKVGVNLVPEPGSLTLLGIGIVCLLGFCWRRRKRAA